MTLNKNLPIGIFDSGLGGLTAVKELCSILPNEDIIYFGDTGRVPYGSRSKQTIINYAKQDIAFLLSKNVKYILAACGTVSNVFNIKKQANIPVPYMGVVNAASVAAANATVNGKIGIIGTEATIASGGYAKALAKINANFKFTSVACPLFVPLVENGHFGKDDEMAKIAAKEYLEPIKKSECDTLILGCTHYPLLAELINEELGGKIKLINSGLEAALHLKEHLEKGNLLSEKSEKGIKEFYVSDVPEKFNRLSNIFMGGCAESNAQRININSYNLQPNQ